MRYVTATLGAIFIFVFGSLLASLLIYLLLSLFMTPSPSPFAIQNDLGTLLGLLAAITSFRASVKVGRPKEVQADSQK